MIGILTRATLLARSGLADDQAVMDWAWKTETLDLVQLAIVHTAVESYFEVTGPDQINPIIFYMNQESGRGFSSANDLTVSSYVIPDVPGPLGSPALSTQFPLSWASAGSDKTPSEVAAVTSWRADYAGVLERNPDGTRPRARRRARNYLPWLMVFRAADATASGVRPALTFQQDLGHALVNLRTAADAVGHPLAVWSRVDWQTRIAVEAWADNAFDTIRSRGVDPTSRQLFVFP
jgi:hypothetical protein